MPQYLHGSDDDVHKWVRCSVCGEWTSHRIGRAGAPLCLHHDLLDGVFARQRAADVEHDLSEALRAIIGMREEIMALRGLIEVLSDKVRELAGGEATADLPEEASDAR